MILYPRFFDQSTLSEIMELKDKSCYITGTIPDATKKELRKMVERKGMIWSKRINGDLDYLIVGEEPGEKKITIAQEIGIKIIPWEEFKLSLK